MGLRPLEIIYSFSAGINFRTQESDVYRRQILTSKVGPHAERVKQQRLASPYIT